MGSEAARDSLGCCQLSPHPGLPGQWGPTTAPSTNLSRRLLRPLYVCSHAAPRTLLGTPREKLQPWSSSYCPDRSEQSLSQTEQSQLPPMPLHSPAGGKQQWHQAGPSHHCKQYPSCRSSRSPLSQHSAQTHSPAGPAGFLQGEETPAAFRGRLPTQPRAWGAHAVPLNNNTRVLCNHCRQCTLRQGDVVDSQAGLMPCTPDP